jgi:hypothetical protein
MTTKEMEALFTAMRILLDTNNIDGVREILNVVLQPAEKERPKSQE